MLGILAALVTSRIILIQIWLHNSKKKKQVLYGCGGRLWIKKIKPETQVTSMSNMLIVSFVVLLFPNFLVEIFDPHWDYPELHIVGLGFSLVPLFVFWVAPTLDWLSRKPTILD